MGAALGACAAHTALSAVVQHTPSADRAAAPAGPPFSPSLCCCPLPLPPAVARCRLLPCCCVATRCAASHPLLPRAPAVRATGLAEYPIPWVHHTRPPPDWQTPSGHQGSCTNCTRGRRRHAGHSSARLAAPRASPTAQLSLQSTPRCVACA